MDSITKRQILLKAGFSEHEVQEAMSTYWVYDLRTWIDGLNEIKSILPAHIQDSYDDMISDLKNHNPPPGYIVVTVDSVEYIIGQKECFK